jgi:hypothetical protein
MIRKRLTEVVEDDLTSLIAGGVAEGRTIEYKRGLPGNTDADKKEFLADASSFANTAGGDLIFGMEEDQGVPTVISGVQATDLDASILRLENMLRTGVSPRMRYDLKVVSAGAGLSVLIVRVERSWGGPHRVVFQNHDKFYGRNAAGKYPLDVNELRDAFALSSTVTDRIRAFRADRIIAIVDGQTPLPFVDSPTVVVHCLPLDAFASSAQYDVLPFYEEPNLLQPMGTTRWDRRLNLEGVVSYGTHQPCHTYTQLYRNGVLEVVNGNILAQEYQGRRVIPSISFERYVFRYLPVCLRTIQRIGAGAPVVVALTLLRARGLTMGVDTFYRSESGYPIAPDTIALPESIVGDLSTPIAKILKPMFDLVWNACGFPGSENFDSEGNWINRG